MKLSEKAIVELQDIYKNQTGETLSETEADLMGIRLLSLFNLVYRPIRDDKNSHANANDLGEYQCGQADTQLKIVE